MKKSPMEIAPVFSRMDIRFRQNNSNNNRATTIVQSNSESQIESHEGWSGDAYSDDLSSEPEMNPPLESQSDLSENALPDEPIAQSVPTRKRKKKNRSAKSTKTDK